jgi:hypothetical protein
MNDELSKRIAGTLANILLSVAGVWLLWSALGWKAAVGALCLALFVVRPSR